MKKDSLLKIARKRTKIKAKAKKRGPCFVKYVKSWLLLTKEKSLSYRARSVEHCAKQSSHFSVRGNFFKLSDLLSGIAFGHYSSVVLSIFWCVLQQLNPSPNS